MSLDLTAGQTEPIDYLLEADGAPVNLSGMTVELVLHRPNGDLVDVAGDVTTEDAAAGRVRYSPDAADLAPGHYLARWKVTDGGGKVGYFPRGAPLAWSVWKE